MLKRYWFTFKRTSARPTILSAWGCGITAYDVEDAYGFLREQVFPAFGEEPVDEIVENIDVSKLEERHVRPNMGNPVLRGVWFPLM